jgi:hypothetical protein
MPRKKGLFAMDESVDDVLLTPWSVVHFLSGAACKGLGWSFWSNFALHGAYEAKDHFFKEEIYNSKFNSVGDQFCSMAGYVCVDKDIKWLYYWMAAYAAAYFAGNVIG